jgi:hypothetical protein
VEVADGQIAVPAEVPLGGQVDVLGLVGDQAGIADRTRAAANPEELVEPLAALQAAIVGAGDGVAVGRPQLDVLKRRDVEVDGGQPVGIVALEAGEAAALEQDVELVL